ncbi:hypothetical protein V502_02792 [Pseudogymnoascus sp. VKM F-4520 (FW-2644)]|nr:hypothetical protein V502_02792 [Pseudogymnoascus sp. VKM F-4520 (FW-2644)]
MASDKKIVRRRLIGRSSIKQLESEFTEESKLDDVLVLCLEAATTHLTSGYTPLIIARATTPGFFLSIQPKYERDRELLDFKFRLDVLRAENKQLADIIGRLLELLLSRLQPKIDEMFTSLNISSLEKTEVEVAYRWNNPGGGTGYHPFIGFYCGQWKFQHESGFKPRSFNDTEVLKDHLRGTKKASPWISMTHIPGHMLEILKTIWDENINDTKHKVHVIDFRKLKLLNLQTTLSQDLATKITPDERFHYKTNADGLKGISYHHWLAQQWIPACCILGSLTIEEFRRVLSMNNIRYKPNSERILGQDWVNTELLSVNTWKTHFVQQPK